MSEETPEVGVPAFIETLPAEREPLWRKVLNYGCVFYFLFLPTLAIFYGATHYTFGGPTSPNAANFLREFHFTVSALVAAMAGLNSFDRYKAHSNGSKIKK